ncbi:MAG: DUF4690 domain-containing protein [Ruminococcaceae bacterium]|nr:DUF4690 domain-containing protein [Oscillospiraceae bacterium]
MRKMRILSVLMVVLFMLSSLSVAAYNLDDYLPYDGEVGSAVVKNSTPTVDGSVSASEGYSAPVTLNYKNMPTYWSASSRCIINADVYFAWDDNGLYVGANITDPTLLLSTGDDNVVDSENEEYGFNGDVFVFAIDPLKACYDIGMTSTGERTAWYCMSIGENDEFMCYSTNHIGASGDITKQVNGAAKKTGETSWSVECMIPWSMICDDTDAVTYGDVRLDEEDLAKAGVYSKCGVIYMDRAIANEETLIFSTQEHEEGDIFTIARAISVPLVHEDGMDRNTGGESLRSYGIKLMTADSAGVAPEFPEEGTPTFDPEENSDPEETKETKETMGKTDEEDEEDDIPEETEKREKGDTATTLDNNGGGISVGLIIAIVAGVVVIAAVVVVVIVVLKKKKK